MVTKNITDNIVLDDLEIYQLVSILPKQSGVWLMNGIYLLKRQSGNN